MKMQGNARFLQFLAPILTPPPTTPPTPILQKEAKCQFVSDRAPNTANAPHPIAPAQNEPTPHRPVATKNYNLLQLFKSNLVRPAQNPPTRLPSSWLLGYLAPCGVSPTT